MHDLDGLESPAPRRTVTFVLAVFLVSATLIGAISGILIADSNGLLILKASVSRQIANTLENKVAKAEEADRNDFEDLQMQDSKRVSASDTVSTGLPSIRGFRYSLQPGFAEMDFDLEFADLVRTGVLDSPDRIYVDLQESCRTQGAAVQPRVQKSIVLEGDPVTRVRIARRESGGLRIVLDLSRSCDFKYQMYPGSPSHLVLKIRPRAITLQAQKSQKARTRISFR